MDIFRGRLIPLHLLNRDDFSEDFNTMGHLTGAFSLKLNFIDFSLFFSLDISQMQ